MDELDSYCLSVIVKFLGLEEACAKLFPLFKRLFPSLQFSATYDIPTTHSLLIKFHIRNTIVNYSDLIESSCTFLRYKSQDLITSKRCPQLLYSYSDIRKIITSTKSKSIFIDGDFVEHDPSEFLLNPSPIQQHFYLMTLGLSSFPTGTIPTVTQKILRDLTIEEIEYQKDRFGPLKCLIPHHICSSLKHLHLINTDSPASLITLIAQTCSVLETLTFAPRLQISAIKTYTPHPLLLFLTPSSLPNVFSGRMPSYSLPRLTRVSLTLEINPFFLTTGDEASAFRDLPYGVLGLALSVLRFSPALTYLSIAAKPIQFRPKVPYELQILSFDPQEEIPVSLGLPDRNLMWRFETAVPYDKIDHSLRSHPPSCFASACTMFSNSNFHDSNNKNNMLHSSMDPDFNWTPFTFASRIAPPNSFENTEFTSIIQHDNLQFLSLPPMELTPSKYSLHLPKLSSLTLAGYFSSTFFSVANGLSNPAGNNTEVDEDSDTSEACTFLDRAESFLKMASSQHNTFEPNLRASFLPIHLSCPTFQALRSFCFIPLPPISAPTLWLPLTLLLAVSSLPPHISTVSLLPDFLPTLADFEGLPGYFASMVESLHDRPRLSCAFLHVLTPPEFLAILHVLCSPLLHPYRLSQLSHLVIQIPVKFTNVHVASPVFQPHPGHPFPRVFAIHLIENLLNGSKYSILRNNMKNFLGERLRFFNTLFIHTDLDCPANHHALYFRATPREWVKQALALLANPVRAANFLLSISSSSHSTHHASPPFQEVILMVKPHLDATYQLSRLLFDRTSPQSAAFPVSRLVPCRVIHELIQKSSMIHSMSFPNNHRGVNGPVCALTSPSNLGSSQQVICSSPFRSINSSQIYCSAPSVCDSFAWLVTENSSNPHNLPSKCIPKAEMIVYPPFIPDAFYVSDRSASFHEQHISLTRKIEHKNLACKERNRSCSDKRKLCSDGVFLGDGDGDYDSVFDESTPELVKFPPSLDQIESLLSKHEDSRKDLDTANMRIPDHTINAMHLYEKGKRDVMLLFKQLCSNVNSNFDNLICDSDSESNISFETESESIDSDVNSFSGEEFLLFDSILSPSTHSVKNLSSPSAATCPPSSNRLSSAAHLDLRKINSCKLRQNRLRRLFLDTTTVTIPSQKQSKRCKFTEEKSSSNSNSEFAYRVSQLFVHPLSLRGKQISLQAQLLVESPRFAATEDTSSLLSILIHEMGGMHGLRQKEDWTENHFQESIRDPDDCFCEALLRMVEVVAWESRPCSRK